MELSMIAWTIGSAIVLQLLVATLWRHLPGKQSAPSANQSFSFPYIGHLFQLLFYSETYLQRIRDGSSNGWLPLYVLGRSYTVVYDPTLIQRFEDLEGHGLTSDTITLQVFENAFSLPPQPAALDAALKLTAQPLSRDLQESISIAAIKQFQIQIPDFVSFMSSLIDQSKWERDTIESVSDDNSAATVYFHDLFRNFTTYHLLSVLLPGHLLETHPHGPTFTTDLWAVHSATFLLATGLPRWVPIPRLTTAHIARRNLLWSLTGLTLALDRLDDGRDPPGEWQNLDAEDVPPFLADFQRSHGSAGPEARASLLLARLLALCTRVTELAFWALCHASSADAKLRERMRAEAEAAGAVRATQPPSSFGITEPVRLRVDSEKLGRCELLGGAYRECVRKYGRGLVVAKAEESTRISLTEHGPGADAAGSISVKKGTFVVAAPWLHSTDPAAFVQPRKWDPERQLGGGSTGGGGREEDEDAIDNSQGLDVAIAGGEALARKLTLILVAGFLAVWDFEIVGGVPRASRSISVAGPRSGVRAQVRRREL